MSNREIRGGLKNLPNPFDIALYIFTFICPVFFLSTYDLDIVQKMFFVFGTFFLWGLSFIVKKEREYRNPLLGILCLWSLACVFIHSFYYGLIESNLVSKYINFALLSEGFIYVFCACVLFQLVVKYSKNFNIAYPILAICILNLFFLIFQTQGVKLIWISKLRQPLGVMGYMHQLKVFSAFAIPILLTLKGKWWVIPTIPLLIIGIFHSSYCSLIALGVATAIYLLRKKWLVSILLLITISILPFNKVVWNKITTRLYSYKVTQQEIMKSPWLGNGFDNSLKRNSITIDKKGYEKTPMLRQNDYLNIARDLGIPFLLVLLFGISKILKRSKKDLLWLSCLTLAINCLFQTATYYIRIGVFAVLMLALLEKRNVREQNSCL